MRTFLLAVLMLGGAACGIGDLVDESGESGVFQISDSGKRCVVAPCPGVIIATPAGQTTAVPLSHIEFPDSMSKEARDQAIVQVFSDEGLLAEGKLKGEGDDRVFVLKAILEP